MITNDKIVPISTLEIVQLHFLSFVYGLYLIVRRFFKWIWDPKKFFMMQQRDKPPPCLVDNNLGIHSYVKIKNVKFHYVEAAAKSSYKIQVLIEELRQFILTLGVKQCSIIGHDLGGLLGWYMVALYGDMIYKFVAISCPHPNFYWNRRPGDSVLIFRWIHFSRLPFLPEIDALKEDLSIINDAFQHLCLNDAHTEKDYVEAYKYAFSRKEDWTGAINYYRNLPFIRLNIDTCGQISTQTLLIIGNMDPIVTIENIVQSSEYIEKFYVKLIPQAQHFPHQQKPDIVNEAILKFFVGTTNHIKKASVKSRSSWFTSLNLAETVKYGNHMFDAVHKRTNGILNVLPNKVLYLGQTTS